MRYAISDKHANYVRTGLDNLGLLLDLPRLPEEDNASYRARIEGVFARPGSSTYSGLANAIGRELGLIPKEALTITCTSADPTANPQIILANQTLNLYVRPGVLEARWFLRTTSVQTIAALAENINATTNFTATVSSQCSGNELSLGLQQQNSQNWVIDEIVPPSVAFHLRHAPVVPGTVVFEEELVFQRYNTSLAKPGDFSLDPATGLVRTVLLPNGISRVAYIYQQNTITLLHSPLGFLNLNSQEARQWFFTTLPKDVWSTPLESLSPALPHPFMQRIIDELIKNCPTQWGL